MTLSPDSVLQLAPGIRTRRDHAGHVLVDSPVGTIIDIGPRGFGVLSLFSEPIRLGDAMDRLEREHAHSTDFAPILSVLNMLIEESALVSPDAERAPTSGWADPVEHARMLHDERRTGDYLAALAAAVRPDDVVLDIGTGSGVLALAAARAGARCVYAVEASDIAEVAERVFAVNGVRDQVTLLPGWSRFTELPEQADLLVAEVIGNEPLEEEILETMLDARRRLLKPGARMIPHALTLFARPILLPEAEVRQRSFGSLCGGALASPLRHRLHPITRSRDSRPDPHDHRGRGGRDLAAGGSACRAGEGGSHHLRRAISARVDRSRRRATRPGERHRSHIPRRVVRGYLPYPRSVDVAGVELGDFGMGPLRSDRSQR